MENPTNQSNTNSNDSFSGGISFDNITNSLTPGFDDISFGAPEQNHPDTAQQNSSAPSAPAESTGNSGDAFSTGNADAFSPNTAEPSYSADISLEHDNASNEANFSAASDNDDASPQSAEEQSDPELQKAIEIAVQAIIVGEKSPEDTIQMLEEQGYSLEPATDAVRLVIQEKQNLDANSGSSKSGSAGHFIFGIICLVAGILLTTFSVGNAIWYGAIIVGIIEIIRGFIALAKH